MLVTTDAIVLRSRKHGETSKIVTLYSKEFGKVDVIAKGARDIKSKFGGALEAFAESKVVFYKKEKAEASLYLLSKAEPVRSNAKLIESLDTIESATAIVELLNRAMHDEEQNLGLYDLTSMSLKAMSQHPQAAEALLIHYYIRFAKLLGFAIQADTVPDSRYNPEQARTHFSTKSGELFDILVNHSADPNRFDEHLIDGIRVSPEARMILLKLLSGSAEAATPIRMSDTAFMNLKEVFRAFFIEHLPGVTKSTLRSSGVFGKLG